MARSRKRKRATRRGSPEVVAKIQSARALNDLFAKAGGADGALDGRTLKRKQRLKRELAEGVNGRPLKALEVLVHANELLALGETLSSMRKLKPRVPSTPPRSKEADAVYAETQRLYGFDPKAWRLLAVDIGQLTPARRRSRSG